ncbi:MAG: tRNA epoxyqueuosine(34) reductase QueG, partial [Nitrospiria bacterium]
MRADKRPSLKNLTREIKNIAIDSGFHAVGITSAEPVRNAGKHFQKWLSDGFAGGMAYLKKSPEIRYDPKRRFPEAKSVIALALNYYQPAPHQENEQLDTLRGKVARYAWGEDYHHIIEEKLETLIHAIQERKGRCWKGYVDHGPLLERAFAQRAGLGFIGKNTNLITPKFGSWVFLAEVITDLDLEEDVPATNQCGTCRRCIEACPTGALDSPYRLDARRCISYLTIENKGEIPSRFHSKMEGWLFGCDICQEICPFNGSGIETNEAGFSITRGAGPSLKLDEIESLSGPAAFKKRFSKTPLLRAKHTGLSRNAAVLRHAKDEPKRNA